jgi:hypothetical protein
MCIGHRCRDLLVSPGLRIDVKRSVDSVTEMRQGHSALVAL